MSPPTRTRPTRASTRSPWGVAPQAAGTVNVTLSGGSGTLRGTTFLKPDGLTTDRFAITGGNVPDWRAVDVFTGGASIDVPDEAATPGGPLPLTIDRNQWTFVGYLACRPTPNHFCRITAG